MSFSTYLHHLWYLVGLGAGIIVINVAFPLWRKLHLRFALLFGWASWLALFCTSANYLGWYLGWPDSLAPRPGTVTWSVLHILEGLATILYAVAVVLMARHFARNSSQPPAHSAPAEENP